jgi:hypothetical protein
VLLSIFKVLVVCFTFGIYFQFGKKNVATRNSTWVKTHIKTKNTFFFCVFCMERFQYLSDAREFWHSPTEKREPNGNQSQGAEHKASQDEDGGGRVRLLVTMVLGGGGVTKC